jgi:hypothetical protein
MAEGRVSKGKGPSKQLRRHTYRDAKPDLMQDFDGRCAYSMQHASRAGGARCMEVDHFDPRLKRNKIQQYANLMLASRHCNGAKSDTWPTSEQALRGVRLINPCLEHDYGVHIVEDPETHELVEVTPPGRYQILVCDLNAPHLVLERTQRAQLRQRLASMLTWRRGTNLRDVLGLLTALEQIVDRMIPPIPAMVDNYSI